MEHEQSIIDMYSRFLNQDYEALALNPEAYPLVPVMERVLSTYSSAERGETVLDLACGPGLLKQLADYAYYSGVDLSPDMLRAAAKRGYNELIQSSLLDYLPLVEDDSYDSVICFSAAYFLSENEAFELVGHMSRIAKKFWLLTLDAVPEDLVGFYAKQGMRLYDHSGMELHETKERFWVEGWQSATDGLPIGMEIAIGLKE